MKKYKLPDLVEIFDNPKNLGNSKMQEAFTNLAERARTTKDLSIVEANYYCQLVDLLQPVDSDTAPINVEDFDVCKNYHFRKLYLQYYDNLNGGKPAYDYKYELISIEQKQKDIQYLESFANEWELVLNKNNYTEEILNYVVKETNLEIKGLNDLPEVKNKVWNYNLYKAKLKAIILHSKYIYITAKEIFESLDSDSFVYNLDNYKIEFNSYSLIHILSRHFAGVVKQYDLNKSFLTSNFYHRQLPNQLEYIFNLVDKSGVYKNQSIAFIPVRVRGIIYSIWTKEAQKSVKVKGNLKYIRIQTLYPTEDNKELQKLASEYKEIKINEEVSVFIKTPPNNT